jgi:N-acetylglucosaminyldiphosphoundecaprenol N-acetyl-beta-D-mannosaminyltransferase
MLTDYTVFNAPLVSIESLNSPKILISTINVHTYLVSRHDETFRAALRYSNILLPDGIGIVWALHWLVGVKLHKIAGADLFNYEMERMQKSAGKVFFLGSTTGTLEKIKLKILTEYPAIKASYYSPPFKPDFSAEENDDIISTLNSFHPDVLFIGMTAPKQEKWAYQHFEQIKVCHICCIGAVFDFYAGNIRRAPQWMIRCGLEWLYRTIKEPVRMFRRNIIGNILFIIQICKEKYEYRHNHAG